MFHINLYKNLNSAKAETPCKAFIYMFNRSTDKNHNRFTSESELQFNNSSFLITFLPIISHFTC